MRMIFKALAIEQEKKNQIDVSLPERCHGDYGVPEGGRDGGKGGALRALLCVEHDSGENDDGHSEGEEQETKLGGAALQRVAQNPQTLRVARKLENSEDAEHPEGDERSAHVLVLRHHQADVVGHDSHHVYDRHHRAHELTAAGSSKQTHEILKREDQHTRRVHAEEGQLIFLSTGKFLETAFGGLAGDRLHYIGDHRHGDEEASDVVEDQRHG